MTDRIITIGFSKSRAKFPIFSWAIRLFEGTRYSHVFLRWTSGAGPEIVYEASGSRIRLINSRYFDEIAETLHTYDFKIGRDDYRKLINFVMTNAGTEYGMKQVLGIALVKIFNLKKNPFSDGRASQVCSETIAYFLEEVMKYDIKFDKDIAGPKAIKRFLDHNFMERK
jgi:hypothetical protein